MGGRAPSEGSGGANRGVGPVRKAFVLVLTATAGCLGSDPYARVARELTAPLGAAPTRVAVLPFRGLDPSLDAEGEAISERLLSYLYGRDGVVLIERSRLQQVMSEMSLGQTGALDAKSAAELGRLSGAQALVVGTVSRAPKGLDLSARVVDVASGRLLAAATARLPKASNLSVAPSPRLSPNPPPASPSEWTPGADLGPGTRLPWALDSHGAAAAGGRLYVLGGVSARVRGAGRGDVAVMSAVLLKSGKLGRWRAETPLPEGRYQVAAAAWGRWVLAVGGYEGSPRREVFASEAGADGRLGPWQTAGSLPRGCTDPGAVAAQGVLHVAGCGDVDGGHDRLESAWIGPDGRLGAWRSLPLPLRLGSTVLVEVRGRLLLLGGGLDAGYSDAVLGIERGADGFPVSVRRVGSLPEGLAAFSYGVIRDEIWLGGGFTHRDAARKELTVSDRVESASVRSDGSLSGWRRSKGRISPSVAQGAGAVAGDVFLALGGAGASGRTDSIWRFGREEP
ncbi:hypothetical protein EPO15_04300 [bacterium]|nr:MAG: hypothetical protein EPO15_04300 [bacterium]